MLMQQKNKMTKTATTADFTMILDSSDVPQRSHCSIPVDGIFGAAF